MTARRLLLLAATPLAILSFATPAAAAVINVVKTAACGCCGKWVEHMKKAGHDVRVTNVEDVTPTARKLGVPDDLRSCHTSTVGGYAIEGHVPAADIARLLREKPKAAGIVGAGHGGGIAGDGNGRDEAALSDDHLHPRRQKESLRATLRQGGEQWPR